jgi:ubiquitin carboxyl-terminal hydrolase 47
LFAELEVSRKDFVDTRGLTTSFGWTAQESFEQQDVQEFFRVLFEAIEQSLELAGESSDTINSLY